MSNVTTFDTDMVGLPDISSIWDIAEPKFNEVALQIFRYQAKNNAVYRQYLQLIDKDTQAVEHYTQIPFLPISFFKTHKVVTGQFEAEAEFHSSSTTGENTSQHLIPSIKNYHLNCRRIFEDRFGSLHGFHVMGLLPHYLERGNSSLVNMVRSFMEYNQQPDSFFLYDHDALAQNIIAYDRVLLFGVSYALLDFASEHSTTAEMLIVETGGMKGRKKEMTKQALHAELRKAFPNANIVSEYGMTELMSQAYSDEKGIYTCPPWMKVLPRPDNDPLSMGEQGKTTALNIIDLANLHSCAFTATDDLGKVYGDGSFEVLGRLDHADVRGCSLML